MLEVRLFGHMRASVKEKSVVPAPPVATQRLWAYLLLHRGRPLARKHVAFTLWPDTDEDDALTQLRRQLHLLQRHLPRPPKGGRPWIVADRVTLQWNTDADYWLDVADFETACAPVEVSGGGQVLVGGGGGGPWLASDRQRLEAAAALYTADLLVDAYDDWVLAERERLGRLLDEALLRLVGLYASDCEPRGAAAAAARLLARDPLREEAHRLVIGLRYLAGDRAAALRAFNDCRRLLARELDVAPMPRTMELVEAIRGPAGPETVVRLMGEELPEATALARAAAGRVPHNLPAPISSFVGRRRELAATRRLLEANRLVTFSGPGGCGKSRLAMELAAQLVAPEATVTSSASVGAGAGPAPLAPDGVWWVDLAVVDDPDLVANAVAHVLRIRDQAGAGITKALEQALAAKTMLIVLDNCEHVVAACASLAEGLLRAAPRLRVLATSREVIGVVGEAVWLVPPMGLPPEARGLDVRPPLEYDAPRLFLERARLVAPGFAATDDAGQLVSAVCRRLEGMPLAIELAAARVRTMPVKQILERLDDRFALLGTGVRTDIPHHVTLAAAIDWSYDLLDGDERALLRRLSVFRGGCTVEAVEAACEGADLAGRGVLGLLASLVAKSLVLADATGDRARYRMQETVRQYAIAKAAAHGEEEALRDGHLAFYADLAETAGPLLIGAGAEASLDLLEAEDSNVRGALRWARGDRDRAVEGLKIAAAIWRFWLIRGHMPAARRRIEGLLAAGVDAPPRVREGALNALGVMLLYSGETTAARERFTEAVDICRGLRDEHRVGLLLGNLGLCDDREARYEDARRHYEASIALLRRHGDEAGVAHGLGNLGLSLQSQGDIEGARARSEEALEMLTRLGDKWGVATTLNNLSQLAASLNRVDEAVDLGQQCLATYRELGDERTAAHILNNLAAMAATEEDLPRAASLLQESIAINRRVGDKRQLAVALVRLGSVARVRRRYRRAAELVTEGAALHQTLEDPLRSCECLRVAELLFASWAHLPTEGTAAADLEIRRDQLARSAKLAACCDAVMEQRGMAQLEGPPEVDATRKATRHLLGPADHEAALAEGAALSLEEAFCLATDPVALAQMARLDELLA